MKIFTIFLLIAALVLFSSPDVFSQKKLSANAETGSVVDEKTMLPVEGASINFYSAGQLTATDEQGKFFARSIV